VDVGVIPRRCIQKKIIKVTHRFHLVFDTCVRVQMGGHGTHTTTNISLTHPHVQLTHTYIVITFSSCTHTAHTRGEDVVRLHVWVCNEAPRLKTQNQKNPSRHTDIFYHCPPKPPFPPHIVRSTLNLQRKGQGGKVGKKNEVPKKNTHTDK